jgi:hypothetical protein
MRLAGAALWGRIGPEFVAVHEKSESEKNDGEYERIGVHFIQKSRDEKRKLEGQAREHQSEPDGVIKFSFNDE